MRTEIAGDAFPDLPDTARLWTFGVSRPLEPREEDRLLSAVDAFLDEWKAHGLPLAAAREWLYDRFLLVGVDDAVTPPSGCSIDALVRTLGEIEQELGLEIVGSAPIWYWKDGELRRVSRARFREEAAGGAVTADTVVFDPSVTRVGELRAGKWELPVERSWHRSYLPSE